MYKVERFIRINTNLEKVYAIAETYPEFVRYYTKSCKILEQSESHLKAMMEMKFLGFPIKWFVYANKERFKKISFEQTQGPNKGLKGSLNFIKDGNFTIVRYEAMYVQKGIFKLIDLILAKKMVDKLLGELKFQTENTMQMESASNDNI